MAEIERDTECAGKGECATNNDKGRAGPDIIGYLKYRISEIISGKNQVIQNAEKDIISTSVSADPVKELRDSNAELDSAAGISRNERRKENECISDRATSSFQEGMGAGLSETQKELLKRFFRDSVAVMNKEVEEATQHVLQVSRMRMNLKKRKLRAVSSSEDKEKGNIVNKKQRMLFLARSEAAYRKHMMDLFRQFGSILKQIMQHKWSWPFIRPVDVAGLGLHNYYDVIKRPMDLGSIRDRMETKDGSGYKNIREICEDVRLVFGNAMTYNQPGTDVHRMAKALLEKFEEKWNTILEPKLFEMEMKREDKQGILDLNGLDSEAVMQKHTDEVFQKLNNVEQQLEELLGLATSNCRSMTAMEKKELVCSIHQLPPSGLNRVMEIITQKNPSFDLSAEEVLIDLDNEVEVDFSDGRRFLLSAEFLRIQSPAANSNIRSIHGEKVISGRRHVGIMSVEPVGNYGIRITFDDLHNTGIYTWDYFYHLGINKFTLMRKYIKTLRKHNLSRDPQRSK